MKRRRDVYVGVSVLTLLAVLTAMQLMLQTKTTAQGMQAGVYQVDPLWPKQLPNHWVFGSVVGLAVDSRDHVWVVHRGKATIDPNLGAMMSYPPAAPRRGGAAPTTESGPISDLCCTEAPPVVEFDPDGNVVGHWGAPGSGYEWPPSMHGITLDGKDNVWLAGNNGNTVLKFSRDGKFLLQIGKNGASKGNTDTANFHNPAEVSVDDAANEAYVADGYGNRRVVVLDATTGKFKRMWGGYGKPPVDPAPGELQPYDPSKPLSQHWRTVHCATLANDGLVYVCDRINARIQVFRKDGTFVKEMQIARRTRGSGVTFDIAFSPDKAQRLMYVADGGNNRVWQLLREPMTVLNHIGDGGRYAGQFYGTHNVSLDSKGNMYTVETYSGARLQKFIYKGQAAVAKPEGPHN